MTGQIGSSDQRLEWEMTFLGRNLEALYRKRHYPLERAHYLLLLSLRNGPMSIGELAASLSLDHSTVTRQLAAMHRRNLVERHPNPADGRSSLIEATDEGRRLADAMQSDRIRRVEMMTADWSDADKEAFGRLLGRLNATLGARLGEDDEFRP
ncbi:MarR family winged helix-turn-helix transcriptional regulator [Consotaella aegiceratis]|uniref:MarR family winged helix-turn-helix transcriptional regulator n=1 Tax=Consotaella aegiceratis TaxID=3097961 RepID=UPI002F40D4F1